VAGLHSTGFQAMKSPTIRRANTPVGRILLAACLVLTTTVGLALADDNSPPQSALSFAQRERARLLAEKTVRLALDTLGAFKDDEIADIRRGALADMQQNVAANRTKTASQQRLAETVERQLQTRIDDEIAQTVGALLADQGISATQFRSELGAPFNNDVATQKQKFVNQTLPQIFLAARADAVKAQTALLTQAAYPTQQEVEQADRNGWKAEELAALEASTRARIAHAVPDRFEETDVAVNTNAKAVMADVEGQRKRQIDALETGAPDGAITSAQIMSALRLAVDNAVASARTASLPGQVVYGILPSVAEQTARKADTEERRHWAQYVRTYKPAVGVDEITARLKSDVARYRDPKDSERQFVEDSIAAAERDVVERYASGARSAPDETAFRDRIRASVAPNGEENQTLKSAIELAIQPSLGEARARIAAEQYATAFGPLQSGLWQPEETAIVDGTLTPSSIGKFDQAAALRGVRTVGSDPGAVLFVETEELAREGAGKLIAEEQTAITLQRGIVKRLESRIKEQLESAPPQDRSSKELWIHKMTDLVTTTWGSDRKAVWNGAPPAIAPNKYSALFAVTNQDIERTIHNLLAEIAARPTQTPTPTQSATPEQVEEEHPNLFAKILEIVGIICAAALALFLLWRWLRRPKPPGRQGDQPSSGGLQRQAAGGGPNPRGGSQGATGGGGPRPGGGKDAKSLPSEIFRGIVVEVRDVDSVVELFNDVTDLRPEKRDGDYAYYKIGPLEIVYVTEGRIPDEIAKGGVARHVERLKHRRSNLGPTAAGLIERE